jgi:hypothetical protein
MNLVHVSSNWFNISDKRNCILCAVNGLKALITNLLAVKGLLRLRAELRAQIKGLTIIIDLICNLLRSPWSHLLATSLNVLVSEGISLPCLQDVCLQDVCLNLSLPVPTSIPTQHWSLQEAAAKDPHFDLQRVLPTLLASICLLTTMVSDNDIRLHRFRMEFCFKTPDRVSYVCGAKC